MNELTKRVMTRYHVRYTIAMNMLTDYEEIQTERFFTLNAEWIEVLHVEMDWLSKNEFVLLSQHSHRRWRTRKTALLAKTQQVHRNLAWVVEKIAQLALLFRSRRTTDIDLDAFLKAADVKARMGEVI